MRLKIWAIQVLADKNKNLRTSVAKICIMVIFGVRLLKRYLVWGPQFRGFVQ